MKARESRGWAQATVRAQSSRLPGKHGCFPARLPAAGRQSRHVAAAQPAVTREGHGWKVFLRNGRCAEHSFLLRAAPAWQQPNTFRCLFCALIIPSQPFPLQLHNSQAGKDALSEVSLIPSLLCSRLQLAHAWESVTSEQQSLLPAQPCSGLLQCNRV